MTNSKKIKHQQQGGIIQFFCPGCEHIHEIDVVRRGWKFDEQTMTVTPSILVRYGENGRNGICHSFIRNGQWQFLSDCTRHELGGQHVDLVDLPDWMID